MAKLVLTGACDASAAALLPDGRLAVADDEKPNVLRVYRLNGSRFPEREPEADRHLDAFLGTDAEADLEATTHIGGRIVWIGSHGRGSDGAWRPGRQVMLATDTALAPVGRVYRALLPALAQADQGWNLGLAAAIGAFDRTAAELAPERQGLSIEGVAHLPAAIAGAGDDLALLGLRNPSAPDGRAILIPLANLPAVLEAGAEPRFAEPYLLELDGLGVRDLAWWQERDCMLVLAGTRDDRKDFRLYRWCGRRGCPPRLLRRVRRLNPEAVVPLDGERVLLLSDDGDRLQKAGSSDGERCRCKDLDDPGRKRSRGRILTLA